MKRESSFLRVAVTGAAGFVGRALLDQLSARGAEIKVLIRNRKAFDRAGVEIVDGDLDNEPALDALCAGVTAVFNLAGVTHPRSRSDYEAVNIRGAANVARAAKSAGATLVHISSLSAREPDLSPYASSKRESESVVSEVSGDWRALRLPAIYGPGDKATLPYFKLIASGFAMEPATLTPACASLLFVEDAAAAIIAGAEAAPGRVYEVGDDEAGGHSWAEIGETLGRVFEKSPYALRVPRAVIAAYHGILRPIESALGRSPSVRAGQVNEFFHADWVARDNLLSDHVDWLAKTSLEDGFLKTVRWYRENGLL